jgi:hypothetical protein
VPSNVVAYTASLIPPLPFRFKSSNLRFQVPDLGFGTLVQRVRFFRVMGETATWRTLASAYHTLKTWMRRTVWGDRVRNVYRQVLAMLTYCSCSCASKALPHYCSNPVLRASAMSLH